MATLKIPVLLPIKSLMVICGTPSYVLI